MNMRSLTRNRTVAVIAGAAVLTSFGGVGGAVASRMITSADIKDGQVKKADIGENAVGSREVVDGSLGERDLNSYTRDKIDNGAKVPAKADPNWGIIDRNVIGNGDSYLRTGPSVAGDNGTPPAGDGSLGIRTGSAQDATSFGDQVDYAGQKLSDITGVKYQIFTTGENNKTYAQNLPNVTFEINPNIAGATYSSMVYVPAAQDPGWAGHDAGAATNATGAGWYFTNQATAAQTNCTQASPCTLADAEKGVPDATIYTVAVNKGRDYAFSGAVDDLQINNDTFDFEPTGVFKSSS